MTTEYCRTCDGKNGICRSCNRGRNRWHKGKHGSLYPHGYCRAYKKDWAPCPSHLETTIHCDGCGVTVLATDDSRTWSHGTRQDWCPRCTELRAVALDAALEMAGGSGGQDAFLLEHRKKELQEKKKETFVAIRNAVRRYEMAEPGSERTQNLLNEILAVLEIDGRVDIDGGIVSK